MSLSHEQIAHAVAVLQQYLHDAGPSDGKTLSELSAERDDERNALIDNQLKPLVEAYLAEKVRLGEFKSRIDDINNRHEHWRFQGFDGQPFFNMVVKLGYDEVECDQEIKAAIVVPANDDMARNCIRAFSSYVRRISDTHIEAGGKRKTCPKVRSVPFFLSYFWQIQDRSAWPVYYPGYVNKLADEDIWHPSGDLAESYVAFKHVYEELTEVFRKSSGRPFGMYDVEHVFCFTPFAFEEGAVPNPLSEAEWLSCDHPQPMLMFLKGKSSDRKLRLFAVACYWRIWHLFPDKPVSRKTLEFAERFADGQATKSDLHGKAWGNAGKAFTVAHRKAMEAAQGSASCAAGMVEDAARNLSPEAYTAWKCAIDEAWKEHHLGKAVLIADATLPVECVNRGNSARKEEEQRQVALIRDVFGNPFRPITLDPSWLTRTVTALAQSIYTDGTFERLPVLAAELVKSGCADSEILGHCREPGPHARGCWALDLVLGKE